MTSLLNAIVSMKWITESDDPTKEALEMAGAHEPVAQVYTRPASLRQAAHEELNWWTKLNESVPL